MDVYNKVQIICVISMMTQFKIYIFFLINYLKAFHYNNLNETLNNTLRYINNRYIKKKLFHYLKI